MCSFASEKSKVVGFKFGGIFVALCTDKIRRTLQNISSKSRGSCLSVVSIWYVFVWIEWETERSRGGKEGGREREERGERERQTDNRLPPQDQSLLSPLSSLSLLFLSRQTESGERERDVRKRSWDLGKEMECFSKIVSYLLISPVEIVNHSLLHVWRWL